MTFSLFDTPARLDRALRRLARAGGGGPIELPFAIDRHPHLAELLCAVKRQGLALAELRSERGESIRDGRLGRLAADPECARPGRVVLEWAVSSPESHRQLGAELLLLAPHLAGLPIPCAARLQLDDVDPPGLTALCERLASLGIHPIELVFTFPALDAAGAARWRAALAELCGGPVGRMRSVRLAGLPFCFLPPQHFELLYNGFVHSPRIAGNLRQQEADVASILSADRRFLPRCLPCRRRHACHAFSDIADHPGYEEHVRPGREQTLVFSGGSLTDEDRREHRDPERVLARPAQQGSVLMALLEGFRRLVILDGYFFQTYSLTTFEVMLALARGVEVIGGASLGALRALELGRHGMAGAGFVFRFLKRRRIAPYHVVAQTYDAGDRAVSVPLVAVAFLLERAVRAGVIDRARSRRLHEVAEGIHFTQLDFRWFFHVLRKEPRAGFSEADVERLAHFFEEQGGAAAFEVKRRDALHILRLEARTRSRPGRAPATARREELSHLRSRFPGPRPGPLAAGWARARAAGAVGRERSPARTLAAARRFFRALRPVVADLSLYDPTGFQMVSLVFPAFFFLGRGLSTTSGFGLSREEALVKAHMELLERLAMWRERLDPPAGRADLVRCTELLGGRAVAVPARALRVPSSAGMASGNTLLEAVHYALLERVERDVVRTWEEPPLAALLPSLAAGPERIPGHGVRALIDALRERGDSVAFQHLPNRYGIPTARCEISVAEAGQSFHGFCARLRLGDAMASAFLEALSAHYVWYAGSRDDKSRGLQAPVSPPPPPRELNAIPPADVSLSLDEALQLLLSRLRAAGIARAYAVDLSPAARWGLHAVRVVVPDLDLTRHESPAGTPRLAEKVQATLALVERGRASA